jgi:uncharacterized damage-inducible protein DinB
MSALRHLRMLTRYTAWANQRLFASLSSLPDDVLGTERNAGSKSMLHTLNHAQIIDRIWQAHLEGRAHGFTARNTPNHPALTDLRRDQERLDAWFIAYGDALTVPASDEPVHFEFVGGGAGAMTRGDILLHVVNHKTYHRGYVAQMLYDAGTRPPTMDLPVFIRDVPLELQT